MTIGALADFYKSCQKVPQRSLSPASKMVVKCFFDIAVDSKGIGRIVFEVRMHDSFSGFIISLQLYDDVVPKTVGECT